MSKPTTGELIASLRTQLADAIHERDEARLELANSRALNRE